MLRRLLPVLVVLAGLAAPSPVSAAPLVLQPPGPPLGSTLPDRMPTGRTSYRTPADHRADLARLVTERPDVARRITLARRSVQGREIPGVELAGGVGRPDDGRPVLVVLGTVHAREWASGEVAIAFAQDLARAYGSDPRVTALLAAVRVMVVPVVNPDGFVASRSGRRRLQRTNLQGVDLNRNAAAWWGGVGSGPVRGLDDYRGPAPWSAPEAAGVHELLRTLPVTALISLHSVAGVVVHPPGSPGARRTADERLVAGLARRMADAAGYRSGRVTRVLYPVAGTLDDWAFAAQGALAATIELGGRGFFGAYRDNVVAEYLGRGGRRAAGDATRATARFRGPGWRRRATGRSTAPPRGGVREALLRAAEAAADPAGHGVLEGEAPAGAELTASRNFTTATSRLCPDGLPARACPGRARERQVPDGATATLTVGPEGVFSWHLGVSTRPFVALDGRQEPWTITCTVGGQVVARHEVVVGRGARIPLAPCAAS